MTILVDSRRKARSTLERAHPGALFLDVTSRGPTPWVRFSPFYPHGLVRRFVEGTWQSE